MAVADFRFFLLSLLLFSSLLCDCSMASTLEEAETWRHYHVVNVSFLLPAAAAVLCSTPKAPSHGAALTVTHRHGPCSPNRFSGNKQEEGVVPLDQVLLQDQSRVGWIQSRLSSSGSRLQLQTQASLAAGQSSSIPARSGRALGTGNYVVTVGFGTPKRDMTIFFDTGSDLTWIQCEPCAAYCYSQQDKIFDPLESKSYLNVSCNSVECSQLTSATKHPPGCSSSTCLYAATYGDQSYTVGFFSTDTLTVGSSSSHHNDDLVFPNFKFGCGQKNRGLFGSAAGLLGLGRNALSFPSQTAKRFGNIFSYCLPSSPSSAGYLTFGGGGGSPQKTRSTRSKNKQDAAAAAVAFTPLLTDPSNPSFYFLELIAITVGGSRLPISASVLSTASTLIDSGTVITRLPPSPYAALRSAFSDAMSKYPSAPPLSILDTCFDLSAYTTIMVPKIALQFRGGAQLDVSLTGILIGSGPSQLCLAFAGNSDANEVAIIGNKQQVTFQVVYDVARKRVGFGARGCT